MNRKIKTCFVGDSTVGKTTLIMRVVEGCFKENITATIGLDYKHQTRKVAGRDVDVELWDTSGQDKFRSVAKNFFRGSDGIFLVFSMVEDKSAESLDFWLTQLRDHLDPSVPIVIFGNKNDLKAQMSQTAERVLKKLQQKQDLNVFMGSAKSGAKIKEAYEHLLVEALKFNRGKQPNTSMILDPQRNRESKQKGGGGRCC